MKYQYIYILSIASDKLYNELIVQSKISLILSLKIELYSKYKILSLEIFKVKY